MQGTDGALYGTATYGGSDDDWGTGFKLNPNGTGFVVVKELDGGIDITEFGGYPSGDLLQGTDGSLYGTTSSGGSGGGGGVFKLNPDGTGLTVIQELDSATGANPFAGLMQGTDGVLYGTARNGGSNGDGTVFKLDQDGTGFTVLQEFDGSATGGEPWGRLIQGTDGALYGTVTAGGSSCCGTVFKLNPDGTGFDVLQNFDGWTTGSVPYARLLQGTDGNHYGTTADAAMPGPRPCFVSTTTVVEALPGRTTEPASPAHSLFQVSLHRPCRCSARR